MLNKTHILSFPKQKIPFIFRKSGVLHTLLVAKNGCDLKRIRFYIILPPNYFLVKSSLFVLRLILNDFSFVISIWSQISTNYWFFRKILLSTKVHLGLKLTSQPSIRLSRQKLILKPKYIIRISTKKVRSVCPSSVQKIGNLLRKRIKVSD